MPRLNESAAWAALAEWCAQHDGYLCLLLEDLIYWSDRVRDLYAPRPPFHAPWQRMYRRMLCMPTYRTVSDVALAPPTKNANARVLFCLFMAEVTKR